MALFLFDYNQLDTWHSRQAFAAIYDCLKQCAGNCAFNDGDIVSPEANRTIASAARAIRPAGPNNSLGRGAFSSIGQYVAAMWTDSNACVSALHNYLVLHQVPGYQGVVELGIDSDYAEFMGFCSTSLSLTPGICLRDGEIIKGTAKYGIGAKTADVNLLRAACRGDLTEAAEAIRNGADVECIDSDDRASTPLFHAAVGGYADVVRLLLEQGANPNTSNGRNTALMIAARFGHLEVVRALIEAGLNVTEAAGDRYPGRDSVGEHSRT